MGKEIVMLPTQKYYLFIYGINNENEIVYRTSDNIKQKITEPFAMVEGFLKTNHIAIPLNFLRNIPKI